jgi:hypothetical protein
MNHNITRKTTITGGMISSKNAGRPHKFEITIHKEYGFAFNEKNHHWNANDEYNLIFIRTTINYLNQLFHSRGYLFLNEALQAFGLPLCTAGQLVGWLDNSDSDIDVSVNKIDVVDKPGETRIWIEFRPEGNIADCLDPR